MLKDLQNRIEEYSKITNIEDTKKMLEDVMTVIALLNSGELKVINSDYSVNVWIKEAILLMFRYTSSSPQILDAYDKIGLLEYDKKSSRYRKAPGAFIRNGVYIGNQCVVMPSYINIGAYVGDRTMIDINASIGSCAQIGENCHISAGSCIGGVLEPVVASPVIIEDNCFIGANAAILEGVLVKAGSVIASGVVISSSTKIIDRESGNILPFGVVPENSVIVPGSYQTKNNLNINCAIIVKKTDGQSARKSNLNNLLRDI